MISGQRRTQCHHYYLPIEIWRGRDCSFSPRALKPIRFRMKCYMRSRSKTNRELPETHQGISYAIAGEIVPTSLPNYIEFECVLICARPSVATSQVVGKLFDGRAVSKNEVALVRDQETTLAKIVQRDVGKLARDASDCRKVFVGQF
jgi:hypothetical protein